MVVAQSWRFVPDALGAHDPAPRAAAMTARPKIEELIARLKRDPDFLTFLRRTLEFRYSAPPSSPKE